MWNALTVCFPTEQGEERDDDGDHLDDPELWHDLTLEDQETVDAAKGKKQHLQCFIHTLQLVVRDGLTEKCQILLFQCYLSSAHYCTQAHQSKMFEAEFGDRKASLLLFNTQTSEGSSPVFAGHKEFSFTA